MPVVSKAQNRYFHAHENDRGKLGQVAREFIASSHGKSLKKLPERKHPKAKRPRTFGSLAPLAPYD